MGDYRNSLLSTTDIASKYLINLHNRGEGETVSIGEEVGGLMSPVGILEEKAEEDLNTDASPLNVQNAAVNSIHGAVANNLKTEQPEYYNYTIKSGDTLGRIASDSGVDMAEIVKLNDIADPNKIRAGAMLRIPTSNVEMFETATGIKFPEEPSVAIAPVSPMSKGFVAPIELQDTDTKIANKLKFYAEKYDLPLDFVTAICANESSFTNVVGDKSLKHSAYGPMQVRLPALQDVQRYYGLEYTEDDLKGLDLNASIETGVAYLAMLRDNYGAKSLAEIAAMYNGGPSAVKNRNANALKYASKVMDFRDRAMKEFNRMIKVTELGPHVSDGDEMFGVVSGGVTKPETEDRDELLDTTEYDLATDPTSFSTIKPIMKYDIDDQTADAFLDRDAYLDKSRPVAIRGTPRLDQANMPMVNYLIDTNELLANTDITDSDKISRMKASIAELTSDPVNFSPDQKRGPDFRDLFASPAFAPTLEEEPVLKPNQLGEPVTNTNTSPFIDTDTDGPAPKGLMVKSNKSLWSRLTDSAKETISSMKQTVVPKIIEIKDYVIGDPITEEEIDAVASHQNPADAAAALLGISENSPEGALAVKGFFENIVPEWEGLRTHTVGPKKGEAYADAIDFASQDYNAWCAAFLTQVLKDSGVDTEKMFTEKGKDVFGQIRSEAYLDIGDPVDFADVKAGDIMIKEHGETAKNFGHVGIVAYVDGDEVWFIGGNTGNKVELSSYDSSKHPMHFKRVSSVSDIPDNLPSLTWMKASKKWRKIKSRLGFSTEPD